MSKTLTFYTSKVSRRGKGAKGTIEVKTLGKPVIVKGYELHPVKAFDYSEAAKIDRELLLAQADSLGAGNEIIMRGIDRWMMSQGIQSQSKLSVYTQHILANGLAQDVDHARKTAQAWINNQYSAEAGGLPVYTLEQLTKALAKKVEKLKAKGQWKDLAPKLVSGKSEAVKTDSEIAEEANEEAEDIEEDIEEIE